MDSETLWLFIKLITLLPLVLVLAYFTIKYGLARSRGFTAGARHMRIVEHLPLGSKGGLTLVELGGRYYLVAFQENSISLLKEFDSLPEPVSGPGAGPGPVTDFREILSQQIKLSQQYLSGLRRQGRSGSGCPERDQEEKK
ncbi:flagellar biosynthetic protein FliO [Desulforamulus putei]|uniref:Flagellar protein n=1 Tax=Desulforamulus putei DSM 12395 TaxID=1121429 RepID=A0A1M5B417_9FIRM|nr:flagellar biosynthetic protein FliO [Desulforamulus putei]SHF37077.1 flagellar protein FliO/FliZ [Desulforamulus putei DSM 12395]